MNEFIRRSRLAPNFICALRSGQRAQRGSVVLDAVIALALFSSFAAATVPLLFGERSLLADGQNRRRAIEAAHGALESVRTAARDDFGGIVSRSWEADGFIITSHVESVDARTKRVRITASWPLGTTPSPRRQASFATLVTNTVIEETCDSLPRGDWRAPRSVSFALAGLIGDPNGIYPITGLDAYDQRLYVTTSDPARAQPTIFVLDISGSAPRVLGMVDNDARSNAGPAAIALVPRGHETFAFLASASGFSRGQLQVIDVTSPRATGWQPRIVTLKLPATAASTAGLGNAIAYRRGLLALGLTAASGGTESNFLDASEPFAPRWLGGWPLTGHAANAIVMRGRYAFVAHPTASSDPFPEQLTVLDISDPTEPARVSGFQYPGGIGGNGKSVAVAGELSTLGRTASRISGAADALPEILAFAAGTPLKPSAAQPLATPESVNALVIRDRLLFALTSSQLQVWELEKAALPPSGALYPPLLPHTPSADIAEFAALPGKGAAMDCENDTIYVGSNDASGKGFITVFTAD